MMLWLDVETLGLEADARVIEIAAMLTTEACEYVGPPFVMVLASTEEEWSNVPQVVVDMHRASGLLEASLSAATSERDGWHTLADWMDEELGQPAESITDRPVLAGSGVHFERKLLDARLPGHRIQERLHYRNVDVSTPRSMVFASGKHSPWVKQESHRALPDVLDAIAEYKHYLVLLGLMPGTPA